MFSRRQLEEVWCKARDVAKLFPVSYDHLLGHVRLAVLPILDEPVQSTLHAILQQNVAPNTKCVYNNCAGTLNRKGQCSERCEQSGINAVQDIVECRNCDSYGFPCSTCNCQLFNQQLKQYLEDY